MAPLDMGTVNPALRLVDTFGGSVGPTPEHFDQLGLYLRAVREHRGWTVQDLAATTRIRKLYLDAIEEGDMSALPSRPFALGYVRGYAQSLGLDGELAVARFKAEHPVKPEPLRAPIGVKHQFERGRPVAAIAAAFLVSGVVAWNFVQHIVAPSHPVAGLASAAGAPLKTPPPPRTNGAFTLGAVTAPPAESTTPAPYITPGLEDVIAPMTAGAAAEAQATDTLPLGAPFEARGAMFGAGPGLAAVMIQARKSALLVVRYPDKQVYFARQMKAGETLRAPIGRNLTIDSNEADAFYTYVNNGLAGSVSPQQSSVDRISSDALAAIAASAPQIGPPIAPAPTPQATPAQATPAQATPGQATMGRTGPAPIRPDKNNGAGASGGDGHSPLD